jgi:hypothetical protein
MSLVEAITNVVVGYGVAVLVQLVLFPVFGFTVTIRQNLVIGLVFTAVSIVRSFIGREQVRCRAGQPRCGPGHGEPLARAG